MTIREIEIHDAWFFTCDDCGRDTWRAHVAVDEEEAVRLVCEGEDWTEEETRLAEALLREEYRRRLHFRMPESAQCDHCGAEFRVALPGGYEDRQE